MRGWQPWPTYRGKRASTEVLQPVVVRGTPTAHVYGWQREELAARGGGLQQEDERARSAALEVERTGCLRHRHHKRVVRRL